MQRLTLEQFRERADEMAPAVHRTPGISVFCSLPPWQLAAHDGLHAAERIRSHLIVENDDTWLVFVEREREGLYFPFEAGWMFTSAVAGDPDRIVSLLRNVYYLLPGMVGYCLGGIRIGSPLHVAVRRMEAEMSKYVEFRNTECMVIDLEAGLEAWLGRRSPKFRRTLRDSQKDTGIEIVVAGEESAEALFERILAVHEQTYKKKLENDILNSSRHLVFYRTLLESLRERGELRLLFAQRGGKDVAYIFGGVAGSTYRGMQMSYIEEVRALGLGNRLQWENLRRCEEEHITRYELGMHSPYKERWADRREENTGIVLIPSF